VGRFPQGIFTFGRSGCGGFDSIMDSLKCLPTLLLLGVSSSFFSAPYTHSRRQHSQWRVPGFLRHLTIAEPPFRITGLLRCSRVETLRLPLNSRVVVGISFAQLL